MKWHLATDSQLETIFNEDDHCPNQLLVGVVEEMMKRGLLEGMIIMKANMLMGTYNRDEVIQEAYIGIYQLAKRFKPMKLSFKKMCYIVIERRLITLLQKKYYKKNHMNRQGLNNQVPEIESNNNVEKQVIRKVMVQDKLSRLNTKQRRIVELFLQGYSLRWIGQHVYNQDTSAIRYQFKLALQKMDIEDFSISKGA